MDYKKKYREAQKWIESIYSELSHEQQMEAEAFFPELKESEDEKIRKWLISQLKIKSDDTNFDLNIMIDKAISWLEKQCEPQDKGEISDGYHTFNELYYYRMLYNAAFFNMLPKEWVHKSKKHHDGENCFGGGWFIVMANLPTGQISNHYELKDWDLFQIPEKERADKWDGHTPQEAAERLHKFLLENQGEQKPADKVEPKFHEGEWITNGDYTWKIVEVKSLDYIIQPQDGIIVDDTISHVDEQFHSFTIEDAKEGDVLVASDDSLFIFAKVKDNSAYYYFSLCTNGRKEISDGNHAWEIASSCHPATKEQRDTLLKAMTDAGWEFDFEKKELKKISQRMVSAEAKEALYDKPTDEEMKELLRTEYEKGRADVLRCIDPDEMVADFCSQPLSKTRSIASIYRQGIIDIIKRINNNEKTSITSTRSIDDGGVY